MIFLRNFNHPNNCWRDSTTRHKQSTRFLECIDDNFRTHVTEELMMGNDLLVLMHINKEKLIWDVKVRDSLICSDHERVGTLLNEAWAVVKKNMEKPEILNALFTLFFTIKICLRESQTPETRQKVWNKEDLPSMEQDQIRE